MMKTGRGFAFAIAAAAFAAFLPRCDAMERLSLDGLWEFSFIERARLESASEAGFSPSGLMPVPGCFDLMPEFYARRGLARYRRSFTLPRDVASAYLDIEGMGLSGRFWIDGREVGTSRLPFSRIELHLGRLAAGRHVISCALDNNLERTRSLVYQPYYDFFLSGGFYHGVSLRLQSLPVELDRVVVRTRDFARGVVELALEAKGALPRELDAAVSFDGGGAKTLRFADGRARVEVPGFRLWSPDSPNLHEVSVTSAEFGAVSARFGVREFRTEGRRFLLNGKPVYLKGVNRHESHPQDGYATSRLTMYRDISLMKSIGCNFVRGSHYTQCDEFLSLCDEMGLLVWEESLGWGNYAELGDEEFMAAQVEQTSLMARASINHPSVVISAFLNEFGSGGKTGEVSGRRIVERLVAAIREADTGHLVTYASSHPNDDVCFDLVDFIAFNSYPSWHGTVGRGSTPESLKAEIRRSFSSSVAYLRGKFGADRPIIVSETGVYAIAGEHDPMGAQWTEEFQAEYVGDWIDAVFESPEMSGFTVWQFCDSRTFFRGGSDIRTKPLGFNMAGLFDRNRVPKKSAGAVAARYRAEPGEAMGRYLDLKEEK